MQAADAVVLYPTDEHLKYLSFDAQLDLATAGVSSTPRASVASATERQRRFSSKAEGVVALKILFATESNQEKDHAETAEEKKFRLKTHDAFKALMTAKAQMRRRLV